MMIAWQSVVDRSNVVNMKSKDKKTEIIAADTEFIAIHGFNSTGVEKILRQAGVP